MKNALIMFLVFIIGVGAGWIFFSEARTTNVPTDLEFFSSQSSIMPIPIPTPDTRWKELSVREKIGQVVCLRYNRDQIMSVGANSTEIFLQKYPVGSFFLANWDLQNYTDEQTLDEVYRDVVSELSKVTRFPLLLAEDFEAGLGTSIPGFTALTREMGLGATGSEQYATWFGEIIAQEARSIGVNWLLHPVADLNVNPFNHLTNIRATGDDPSLARKLLPFQIDAMQNLGVAATAKHFPGDGHDHINQHFSTSQMGLGIEDWQQQHGLVFKSLIDEGVMTIMPGHITFPGYQKEQLNGDYLPATLSHELMTVLLKAQLGFQGVIVSDALNMAGIYGYYENQLETEIESFKAGTDILLWPSLAFIDTLEARITRREISMSRLDDAVSRVWSLKHKLGLFDEKYQTFIPLSTAEKQRNQNRAAEIAQHALTLIGNKNQVLPLNTQSTQNILLIQVSTSEQPDLLRPFKNQLEQKNCAVEIIQNLSYFENEGSLEKLSNQYDVFIFAFTDSPGDPWGSLSPRGEQALTMWTANKLPQDKVISIGFGDPYLNLLYMPKVWCRVNSYSTDENTQRALANAITGDFEMTGLSPVMTHKPANPIADPD